MLAHSNARQSSACEQVWPPPLPSFLPFSPMRTLLPTHNSPVEAGASSKEVRHRLLQHHFRARLTTQIGRRMTSKASLCLFRAVPKERRCKKREGKILSPFLLFADSTVCQAGIHSASLSPEARHLLMTAGEAFFFPFPSVNPQHPSSVTSAAEKSQFSAEKGGGEERDGSRLPLLFPRSRRNEEEVS